MEGTKEFRFSDGQVIEIDEFYDHMFLHIVDRYNDSQFEVVGLKKWKRNILGE